MSEFGSEFGGRADRDREGWGGAPESSLAETLDIERDQDRLSDLRNEREQERTGRFGMRSTRESSWAEKALEYARSILRSPAVRSLLAQTPAGPVPGVVLDLAEIASLKARGYSEEDINKAALGLMVGVIGAPLVGPGMVIGKTAQAIAKAAGAKGGPQTAAPSHGEARDVDPFGDDTKFDRGQLLRRARQASVVGRRY